MSYKIEKPECAPSWFVPGIKCNVWNNPNVWEAVIVWFDEGRFIDSKGGLWNNANPIESWEPMEGEWVAAWDAWYTTFTVSQYKGITMQGRFENIDGFYDHIARITDCLDLRCTPEELKQRTDWK